MQSVDACMTQCLTHCSKYAMSRQTLIGGSALLLVVVKGTSEKCVPFSPYHTICEFHFFFFFFLA